MPQSQILRREDAPSPRPSAAGTGPGGRVLIAGGGIGGLALSLALARRGIASVVLEKRQAYAEEGAGIQLGPNGTRVLAEIGAAALLAPHVAKPEWLRMMDARTGRQIVALPLGAWLEARHGSPYWTCHRADLHAALLGRVRAEPLIRLALGAPVTGLEQSPGLVRASTGGGDTLDGRALIAADGVWSGLRGRLFPGRPDPAPLGSCAFRSVIAAASLPAEIDPASVYLWLGPGLHVVHYPVRAAAEHNIVAIMPDREVTQSWGLDVLSAVVREKCAGLAPLLRQVLGQPPAWRKWSLFVPPRYHRLPWVNGRAALLGDAAHPVLPFLAQGGVLALEDACVLARCLQQHPNDAPVALAAYEAARRARAGRVSAASRRNGHIYHLSGLAARARDEVLQRLSPARLMAGYDWLYGWKL